MHQLATHIAKIEEGIAQASAAIPGIPVTEAMLARLLLMIGGEMQDELEGKLKPFKLKHSDFLTLMSLFSRPDGSSTPGELCVHTFQGATNMTRITNELVKRGLIVRGPSKEDRRRVLIRITPAGRRFVKQLLPQMFPRLRFLFDGFSTSESRMLGQLLRKLAHNLDRLHAGAVEQATPMKSPPTKARK